MVSAFTSKSVLIRGCGFLLIWFGLNLLILKWGDHLARALLPLYEITFSMVSTYYRLISIGLDNTREPAFNLQVMTIGDRMLGRQTVPNDVIIAAKTLQGHAFQTFIIMLSILFIWPLRRSWHRVVLLVIAFPILLIVLMLDVPLVLLGSVENLVLSKFQPEALAHSYIVGMMKILNGGGRLFLGIAGAGISVLLTLIVFKRDRNSRVTI